MLEVKQDLGAGSVFWFSVFFSVFYLFVVILEAKRDWGAGSGVDLSLIFHVSYCFLIIFVDPGCDT